MSTSPRRVEHCPFIAFNQAANGKYKLRILFDLIDGPRRYGELRRSAVIAGGGKAVTPRILSRELKELEQRGLLHRRQYPVVPPKVEYSLTELGTSLVPIVRQVVRWGTMAGQEVVAKANRSRLRARA